MAFPKGFGLTLKKLIRDGIPPRQAMSAAWKIHGRRKRIKNPRIRRIKKTFRGVEQEFRKVPGIKKRTARRYATRLLSKARRSLKRKNPIAVFNPKGTILPASDIEIRYKRTSGAYAGEWFKHPFKSPVKMIGLSDGSVLIKSESGEKLWGRQ